MADYNNNEEKKAAENTKNQAVEGIEKAEQARKIKKWVTRAIAVAKIISVGMIIGAIMAVTTFFVASEEEIDRNRFNTVISATEQAFGDGAYNTIIFLDEEGRYRVSYGGETGRDAIESILEDNGMTFENFTEDELDCLYSCLRAEWATSYPNLGQ